MSDRLAMFPLPAVLAPNGLVKLHVFEPRYRVLMFDCLRGDREFGVVLIERGSEVGGDDQRFDVGTVARIAEAVELADGRWFLLAVGTRRIDVVEWLDDDPYPVALVDERPELSWPVRGEDAVAAESAFAAAERAVRRAVALAASVDGEEEEPFDLSDDRVAAAWELVAVAPLGSLDKQLLLVVDDHTERLRMLTTLADERAVLLTYRRDQE